MATHAEMDTRTADNLWGLTRGESLLAVLDSLVKSDGRRPPFTGTVSVCVRGERRTSYWRAIAADSIQSDFVECVPIDTRTTILISYRAAEAMIRCEAPAYHELFETAGDRDLLDDFLARYCDSSVPITSAHPTDVDQAQATSERARVAAFQADLCLRFDDALEASPEAVSNAVRETIRAHATGSVLQDRLTRAADINLLNQNIGTVRVAELLASDYDGADIRTAREMLGRLREAAQRAVPNHMLGVREFAGKHRLAFGPGKHPDQVTFLKRLAARYESAPNRLGILAFTKLISTFPDRNTLEKRFRGILLRRTDDVDIPPLSDTVGALARGLARLQKSGTCNAHYYAFNRHIAPPVKSEQTWTVFDVIDHVSKRLNSSRRLVGGIQMHIDDGRDGFTLRQMLRSGVEGRSTLAELSRKLEKSDLSINLDCSESTDETFGDLLGLVDVLRSQGTQVGCARFYIREDGDVHEIVERHVERLVVWAKWFHSSGVAFAIENHEDLTSYEILGLIQSVNARLREGGSDARLRSKVDFANDFNSWPASAGEQAIVVWNRIHGADGKRGLTEPDIRELNGIVVNALRALIKNGLPVAVDVKSVAYWDPVSQQQGQFGVPAGMGDTPQLLLTFLLLISDNEQLGAFGIESVWGYSSPIRRDLNSIDRIGAVQTPSVTHDPAGSTDAEMRRLELKVAKNDVRYFYEMLDLLHAVAKRYEELGG